MKSSGNREKWEIDKTISDGGVIRNGSNSRTNSILDANGGVFVDQYIDNAFLNLFYTRNQALFMVYRPTNAPSYVEMRGGI